MSSAIENYVYAADSFFGLPRPRLGFTSTGSGLTRGLPRGRFGGAFIAAVTRFSMQRAQRQRGYRGTCFAHITPPDLVRRIRLLRRPLSERNTSSGIVVRSQSSDQGSFGSPIGVLLIMGLAYHTYKWL